MKDNLPLIRRRVATMVPVYTALIVLGWHGAASAAGLAPLTALLTFFAGAAQTIAVLAILLLCGALAIAHERMEHGGGRLVTSVMYAGIAVSALAFSAQLGIAPAGAAMLP